MNSRFERQRGILEFGLASLLRRKWRNASLLIIYTLVTAALSSVMFFAASARKEAALLLSESPEIVLQRMEMGRHAMASAALASVARAVRGVASAEPRLWGYYYDAVSGANFTLMARPGFVHGRGAIAIGGGVARARAASAGDMLPFAGADSIQRAYRIAEVMLPGSELLAADMVLISEEDFRDLFGLGPDAATDIAVSVKNPREVRTVAGKLMEAIPGARPILRQEALRTYEAVFDWRAGVMAALLAGAVLAFAVFAADRASGLSAEERMEIGILKALGWETSDVLVLKAWEGAVVSLVAFFAGTLLGYAHVYFLGAGLFEPVLKGWSVLYPEFRLAPAVNAHELFALFFLTVAPYTAATLVPSWRAATSDPEMAIRE